MATDHLRNQTADVSGKTPWRPSFFYFPAEFKVIVGALEIPAAMRRQCEGRLAATTQLSIRESPQNTLLRES